MKNKSIILLFFLISIALVAEDWKDISIRPPGVDMFGHDIKKNMKYYPHWVKLSQKDAATPLPLAVAVIDGDTFVLLLQIDGVENANGTWDERIRIADIDTPEKGMPFADSAKKRLIDLIHFKLIKVVPFKRGRYRRILADVFTAEGENVAIILLREGLARCYQTCRRKEYFDAEAKAKKAKIGIWSIANSRPEIRLSGEVIEDQRIQFWMRCRAANGPDGPDGLDGPVS